MMHSSRYSTATEEMHPTPDDGTAHAKMDFYTMASKAEDTSTIYRSLRPVWASIPIAHLVEPADKVMSMVPSSRLAVLHYVGMLTHEATHLYFSKKENPHFGAEHGNLEKAVSRLTCNLIGLLSTADHRGLPLQVVKYLSSLFVEICQCNCERPIAKQAAMSPRPLLRLFEASPSIASILKLFDKAVAILLRSAQEECFAILEDGARQGFCFNWVWLHIAASFPGSVMSHLLISGADDFKQYAIKIAAQEQQTNQTALFETHQLYAVKFTPLTESFAYLASKRNAELSYTTRHMLIEGIARLEEADVSALSPSSDLSIPFLFKLVASSPDVLRFIVNYATELVKSSVVVKACMQMSHISKHCILPIVPGVAHNYMAFLKQFTCFLDVEAITSLLDTTIPFAFDQHVFHQFPSSGNQLCAEIRAGAVELVNKIVAMMCSSVHSQPLFAITEKDALGRCALNSAKLREYVKWAMTHGERGQFSIRFLYTFCLVTGKTSEVIARFMSEARDKQQLRALRDLVEALAPMMPNAPQRAIEHFVLLRDFIEKEKKSFVARLHLTKRYAPEAGDGSIDLNWIKNLKIMHEWHREAHQGELIKYIRFEIGRQYGELMAYLLKWTSDVVSRLNAESRTENRQKRDEERSRVMESVIELTVALGYPRALKPRLAYKICAQFASILTDLLKPVGDEEQPTACDVFTEARVSLMLFLDSQATYVRGQFAKHFLHEAFAESKKLFGAWSVKVEDRFSKLSLNDWNRVSLFDRARQVPLQRRKAAEWATCGILDERVALRPGTKTKEEDDKREHAYMNCIQPMMNFAVDGISTPYVSTYRQLAVSLTELLCKEGLTSSTFWDEWDVEKESKERYLKVSKTVADVPFIWPMMSEIANVHPCLWYCIPVLKAVLATIMFQFENNSNQCAAPSRKVLSTLRMWFELAVKGKILPSKLMVMFDVIMETNNTEGARILLDLWRYFQGVVDVHTINSFNDAFTPPSDVSSIKPITGDVTLLLDACRNVIFRNMPKFGDLLTSVMNFDD